jgi:carotenoid 1,2-hydratase
LGPRFDAPVPPGGYLWWYLDGLSSDGRFAITLIAFVGSVFSPYYAWRGRRDPLNHCAVNVALYGGAEARWAMTERGRACVQRDPRNLHIGPSALHWQGGTLKIDVDEIGAPLPKPIRGTIRVTPSGLTGRSFALDRAGNHVWQPIAPRAHIDVKLERPDLRWSGTGYLDSNYGSEPLQDGFSHWSWSRAHLSEDSVVLYDAARRDGSETAMALRFAPDGAVQALAPPPPAHLPFTAWRIARPTRADRGHAVQLVQTLEDTPFYARSRIQTQLYGEQSEIFHESLMLDRFASPVVRAMLPFRMPRRFF